MIIQSRLFKDKYSIMARVFTPEKKFYEHPTLIELDESQCMKYLDYYIKNPPTMKEVLENWVLIGT